ARIGRRWALISDVVGTFIMLAIPTFTDNVWAIGTAAAVGGFGGAMWSVVVASIRQQAVPDALQGRTSGVFRLFGLGALPLGAALAGIIAEVSSIPLVFGLCAAAVLLLIPLFQNSLHFPKPSL